jgi:hypothetical protein
MYSYTYILIYKHLKFILRFMMHMYQLVVVFLTETSDPIRTAI